MRTNYSYIMNGDFFTVSGVSSEFHSIEDEGIANLRTAVIESAIEDFVKIEEKLARMPVEECDRRDEEYEQYLDKVERTIDKTVELIRFFKSPYCQVLCCGAVTPEQLLGAAKDRAVENGSYVKGHDIKLRRAIIQDERKRIIRDRVLKDEWNGTSYNAIKSRIGILNDVIHDMEMYKPKVRTPESVQAYYDDLELIMRKRDALQKRADAILEKRRQERKENSPKRKKKPRGVWL